MNDIDKAMDLTEFADTLVDSTEYLRAWRTPEGLTVNFVDPRPVGADPILFGVALLDVIEAAAKTYARAVNIPEEEAAARIWAGLESQRGQPTSAKPVEAGANILASTHSTER